jgi:hypothetical protein
MLTCIINSSIMKRLISSLPMFFFTFMMPVQAQDANAEVQRALLDYIEGFYEGDSSKIIRSIDPAVVKYGYWRDSTGQYTGEPMSYREMIDYANKVKARNRPQQEGRVKMAELFEVQDQTATGKVTAWWGTDYILLAKVNNKWMIRMVIWQGPLRSKPKSS